jgi:hypothetical protein
MQEEGQRVHESGWLSNRLERFLFFTAISSFAG